MIRGCIASVSRMIQSDRRLKGLMYLPSETASAHRVLRAHCVHLGKGCFNAVAGLLFNAVAVMCDASTVLSDDVTELCFCPCALREGRKHTSWCRTWNTSSLSSTMSRQWSYR
jgi:hypothetical protein